MHQSKPFAYLGPKRSSIPSLLLMVLLCSAALSFLPVKSAHAWDNQFLLSVTSQDIAGNIITGYYVTFWQNGKMLGSGFTPTAFPLTVGQTYQVQAADFGGCTFHNWRDTGSTDRTRSISISTDPEIIAVYSCLNDNFGYPSTTIIGVVTTDVNNKPFGGLYVGLWQNGALLSSCFSPCSFTVPTGQSFWVSVSDYSNFHFAFWSDFSLNRFHGLSTGPTPIALQAIYNT